MSKRNSSLKALINQYKEFQNEEKKIFKDNLFPPDNSSIFSINPLYKNRNPKTPQSFFPIEETFLISQFSCLPKDKKFSWSKLSNLNLEYNIIKNNGLLSLSEDIIPGEIGNCYFTSAIKFLSEVPSRISNIIKQKEKNENQFFEGNVYIHGIETKIIIDDYFPYDIENNKFNFCQINERTKNIWPMILEKIWAKINSSYEDTISGCISDAFEFLTPCPIKKYYHDIQYDNLFTKISKAIDEKYIICCDITSSNDNILLRKLGVISNHAYKILAHGTIRNSKGKTYNLLKIYNPFHTTTWTGNWSPYSSIWTNEYMKHLKYNPDKEKNVYWIEMSDYLKFYTTTYICFYQDDCNYISKKIPIGGINNIFTCAIINIKDSSIPVNQIIVNNQSNVSTESNNSKNGKGNINSKISYFIVNLKNKRFMNNYKKKEDYENLFVNVTLVKKENDNFKYIDSVCGREERIFIPVNDISEGEYIISINFPYLNNNIYEIGKQFTINPSRPNSITIGFYSYLDLNNVSIEEYSSDKFDKIIIKNIYEKAKLNSHLYYFDKEKENETLRSINFENEKGAFGYLVLDNKSDASLFESINLCEYENVNLISFVLTPNKKSKDKNSENKNLIETQDNLIDDINTRKFIEILSQNKFINQFEETKITPINYPNNKISLSQENPFEILLQIGSKNTCILIFEKCDEYAAIDIRSQITFRYPLYVILKETKTNSSKSRLKYNNNDIEIYECIIEHSSGVVFYYKNKTRDMSVRIIINFKEMKNLKFGFISDMLFGKNENINEKSNEISLCVDPNENKFIEMRSINIFESFNYNFSMNYFIFYSKSKKLFQGMLMEKNKN